MRQVGDCRAIILFDRAATGELRLCVAIDVVPTIVYRYIDYLLAPD